MYEKKEKLGFQAYEPIPEGKTYEPFVPAIESPAEFTFKAGLTGVLLGIVFGAANAYLGLRAGLTISTSIPISVMTVAGFRLLRMFGIPNTILESNMSQTIGSASSSVASGVIFTLPALFLWGFDPTLIQMTLLAIFGGILGTLFMIPLRPLLIVKEHGKLPYPEGTACAEVLVASEVGGSQAKNVFLGIGAGALFKFLAGWIKIFPERVQFPIPFLKKSQLGLDISASLFGVGFILGPRIGTIMVAGGLLSWLVIIPILATWGAGRAEPFYPETVKTIAQMSPGELWSRYIRYIGAGSVASAGLITLVRSIPTMIRSFRMGAKQFTHRLAHKSNVVPRTEQDLPLSFIGIGAAITAIAIGAVPHVFGNVDSVAVRLIGAVLVVILSFFFVTVASRIVGLVGVTSNPTSGMTIASLLITSTVFLMLGWTDAVGKATALTVGCVVAIAASIAGDTSQDLKTGFLLGATPHKQQSGQLLGVLTCAAFVCLSVLLLDKAYGFGTSELPAPQATLMKLVIEGVINQALPWSLVGIGAAITVAAELLRVPSLPFAVGIYLPITTTVPVFLGGLLRLTIEKTADNDDERNERREKGILFGSGLVGGEGLLGVGIAAVAFFQGAPPSGLGHAWAGSAAPWVALAAFALLATVFVKRCKSR